MASIFTYQEEPPRVHSPWSTPGSATPQTGGTLASLQHAADGNYTTSMTKLEPERQDGPTEYKLHLLLRLRGTAPGMGLLSKQSRQARLQQLTTQLLWRLQQSSPFHSSSNSDLVLPLLPEATPRLGLPERPAKLLPGLEESQGALYEIGVADDGSLVGLVDEEMEESLTNLRAMAASLGCVVDILRRVIVGQVPWKDSTQGDSSVLQIARLWVAEVLVRPDVKSPRVMPLEDSMSLMALSHPADKSNGGQPSNTRIEQLRVAVVGASTVGKSSLVGTLTTSTLDNGRGKSRLSLLKHRHEIASGVTSSVAQELIGYRHIGSLENAVVNYASGDVSSWPDIHGQSSRLVFLSDSPGLPRYAKSAFRTLISWDPEWTLLCVAANEAEAESPAGVMTINHSASAPGLKPLADEGQESVDVSLAYLDMCVKLGLRMVIIITKMDIATKSGLKANLSKVLSALKKIGKVPVLLSAPSGTISKPDENTDIVTQLSEVTETERSQLEATLRTIKDNRDSPIVPIVLTSAVTGSGFGKLHKLLEALPTTRSDEDARAGANVNLTSGSLFHIDETFAIPPSRVYTESKQDHCADHGIVLCGNVARGTLSIGDQLRLGPFWLDIDSTAGDSGDGSPRVASPIPENGRRPMLQSLSGDFSKSLQGDRIKIPGTVSDANAVFIDVHVVSLRSLRLPVKSMSRAETGTVGVQPLEQSFAVPLSRARKGMILSVLSHEDLAGYRSFSAIFSTAHFASMNSAPLILGGHAIAYVNSIRAAVKVIAVALNEDTRTEPASPVDVFDFDGDHDTDHSKSQETEVRITFKFVSSVEWMEVGDQVLIVPTVTAAGPVSGPPSATVSGLSGFVGRVSGVSC